MTALAYLIVGILALIVIVPIVVFGAVIVGIILNWLAAVLLAILSLFGRKS